MLVPVLRFGNMDSLYCCQSSKDGTWLPMWWGNKKTVTVQSSQAVECICQRAVACSLHCVTPRVFIWGMLRQLLAFHASEPLTMSPCACCLLGFEVVMKHGFHAVLVLTCVIMLSFCFFLMRSEHSDEGLMHTRKGCPCRREIHRVATPSGYITSGRHSSTQGTSSEYCSTCHSLGLSPDPLV